MNDNEEFNTDIDEFFDNDINDLSIETDNLLNIQQIPGFLMLDKTFGKKGKKYFYKVKPFDRNLPSLIIPYEQKDRIFKREY